MLGIDPARVFKTLMVDVDGRLAVGVVPVSGNLDLKAMAAALGGKKAAMADPATAERRTGYVLGGISPLGQRQPSPPCWTRAHWNSKPFWSRAAAAAWTWSSARRTWCG